MRRGKGHAYTNSFFLFSGVAKEGWRTDLHVLKDHPVDYVAKTLLTNITLPRVMLAAAAYGLLGDDLKEVVDKIPDHYKANYIIIPWGLDENGKAVFTPIAVDFVGQAAGNFAFVMSQLAMQDMGKEEAREMLMQMMSETLPWGPGKIHPFIQANFGLGQYLQGQNPNDLWMGRPAIPARYYEEGAYSPRAMQAFAKWYLSKLGASVVVRWDNDEYSREISKLNKLLKAPIIGPFGSRFIRVSDYGIVEEEIRISKEESREGQRKTNARRRFIVDSLETYPDASLRDIHAGMKELGIEYSSIANLKNAVEKVKLRRSSDQRDVSLSYATSKADREEINRRWDEREKEWGENKD